MANENVPTYYFHKSVIIIAGGILSMALLAWLAQCGDVSLRPASSDINIEFLCVCAGLKSRNVARALCRTPLDLIIEKGTIFTC